ncbi:hypothetical protein ABT072_33285 [Streptomyces sp. NPDC002589]|uniref:hypothetical protein n=1 Tax=Streptomyces sp. NPDC002589 TaxID=3154420 RepID=UPI00332DBA03
MRELSSAIKLVDLDACWAAGGFTRVPVPEGRSGGARKALFNSYADGVSLGDEEEVQRALGVFEAMLRRCRPDEPSPYWVKTLAEITEEFAHGGYEISPSLKILGKGAWRPEHAREDDLAYKEALRFLRGARNQLERLHRLTKGTVEERLRDILLVALNTYVEGLGTGGPPYGDRDSGLPLPRVRPQRPPLRDQDRKKQKNRSPGFTAPPLALSPAGQSPPARSPHRTRNPRTP